MEDTLGAARLLEVSGAEAGIHEDEVSSDCLELG